PLCPGSPVPSFAFPEQAAAALGRVGFYSRWRRSHAAESADDAPPTVDEVAAAALLAEMLADEAAAGRPISTTAARNLLGAYGVEMPDTRRVPAGDAVAAADVVGY